VTIIDWEYTAIYDAVRRTNSVLAKSTSKKSVLHFLCGGAGSEYIGTFRHLAPELQKDGCLSEPTRAGDVYSFGIIIRDLFVNSSGQNIQPTSDAATTNMPAKARQIMEVACNAVAIKRPTFEQLEKCIRSAVGSDNINLLDWCVDGFSFTC